MIGQIVSHYEVTRHLGSGGMGQVFLAQDLALGRQVALKTLRLDLDASLRDRLMREARACARLQHPAIATFYESGEADGVEFLALEYVEGETLRRHLRHGPLEPARVLAIAFHLLEALAHAHAAKTLHRDIKPENIILTPGGSPKLLDFGLAKLTELDSEGEALDAPTVTALTELTVAGQILGTIGYMAPEQLRGEPADERSDIFAVGTVLYECLAGVSPFQGRSQMETLAAILSRDPPPLPAERISADLGRVVLKALARDPAERYASAAALLADLRRIDAGEAVAELKPSLAIVDFENLRNSPGDDWIGSGVAESIAADLANTSELRLIPRERVLRTAAALAAQGTRAEASELGRALGCRWVLTGGFQRLGESLRVTAQLFDATTDGLLAAEKIDGEVDDLFRIQDQLATLTAERLELTRKRTRAADVGDPHIEAYELYTRAWKMLRSLKRGFFDQIGELFNRAIEIQPDYAPALAGLSAVSALRFLFTADHQVLEDSVSFARRAIRKDPDQHEAYTWLGYSLLRLGRPEEGLEAEETAMRLNPTDHFPAYFAGVCLLVLGRIDQALERFQQAVRNTPTYNYAWLLLGETHLELGNFREATWCLRKAVELEIEIPETSIVGARVFLGECLRRTGQLDEARRHSMEGLETVEKMDHAHRDVVRGLGLCVLGRVALDQNDVGGARAAFQQVLVQLEGRPRAISGGHLVVQAMAGLTRAGAGAEPFDGALALFEARRPYDFSFSPGTSEGVALLELARAALALGRIDQARGLLERARAAGSGEAASMEVQ